MQLQIIFDRVKEKKTRQKFLRKEVREVLDGNQELGDIETKIKALRERKKQILLAIEENMTSQIEEIETLKIDIASDTKLLSDAAMTLLMKGERVEVVDQYGNAYDPEFKVDFKKA